MSDLKTKPTDESVESFLNAIEDETRRADAYRLLALIGEATGEEAKMWGPSIVSFGSYHYRYESGREGDFFLAGFSPRSRNFSLYLAAGFEGYEELLARLGKHRSGKSCLYINRLDDVEPDVLGELIRKSVEHRRLTNQ